MDDGGDFGILSNERVIEMPDGSGAAAAPTGRGRMRYNASTGLWEMSSDGDDWVLAASEIRATGQTVGATTANLLTIDGSTIPSDEFGLIEHTVFGLVRSDITSFWWIYGSTFSKNAGVLAVDENTLVKEGAWTPLGAAAAWVVSGTDLALQVTGVVALTIDWWAVIHRRINSW